MHELWINRSTLSSSSCVGDPPGPIPKAEEGVVATAAAVSAATIAAARGVRKLYGEVGIYGPGVVGKDTDACLVVPAAASTEIDGEFRKLLLLFPAIIVVSDSSSASSASPSFSSSPFTVDFSSSSSSSSSPSLSPNIPTTIDISFPERSCSKRS